MNTKLTLNIRKTGIEKAKDYAKDHRVSLSKLIENYLNNITDKTISKPQTSQLVERLTGIIPEHTDPEINNDYYEYLNQNTSEVYDFCGHQYYFGFIAKKRRILS